MGKFFPKPLIFLKGASDFMRTRTIKQQVYLNADEKKNIERKI